MGLFSGVLTAVGSIFGGPLGGALGGFAGGLFDRNRQQDALDDRTSAANAMSREERIAAQKYNRQSATTAFKRDRSNMKLADRMNDKNARIERRFNAREAEISRDRTDAAALRNRRWAKQDYRQTKQDQLTQFTRLRAAADRAGLNPLSVLGANMVPAPAGGLTSSSYGAASGAGVSPVPVSGASSPMSYGAPVAVSPLASNDAVEGAVVELGRELTGEAAIDRANAQIYQDIAKIELEKLQAGMSAPVVPSVAPSVPMIGRQAHETGNTRVSDGMGGSAFSMGKAPSLWQSDPYASPGADFGREGVPAPVTTGTGIIRNRFTDMMGMPEGVTVALDPSGEVLTAGQLAAIAAQAAPQAAWQFGKRFRSADGYMDNVRSWIPKAGSLTPKNYTRKGEFEDWPTQSHYSAPRFQSQKDDEAYPGIYWPQFYPGGSFFNPYGNR